MEHNKLTNKAAKIKFNIPSVRELLGMFDISLEAGNYLDPIIVIP